MTFDSQNDATSTAAITSSEVDYYTFIAKTTGSYRIAATTPASSLDTVLGLFSATGQRLAYNDDTSTSNLDSQITVTLTAGTSYLVGITNYSGTANGSYTWRIDGPAAAPTANDDTYENNDALATASNLGTLATSRTINGLTMADAGDYFKFTTSAAGTSDTYISISSSNTQGDLDLELYNSAGTLVGRSETATNVERISLSGLAAGTYTARVYPYRSATNFGYSLSLNPPTVTSTPTIDLAGAGLTVTNSSTWGQTITVSAAVRNSGNASAGSFSEQWYLSRDGVGSSDDILLSRTGTAGNAYRVANLAANSVSTTFNVTLQLPASLPSGWAGTSFYLVMRTDASGQVAESNESNNFGQAGRGLDFAPITIGAVAPPPTGGFQIQLNMTGLTVTQQSIFQSAARRWEQVIIGDLPNATYNGQTVDDLLIDAGARAIDGVGGTFGEAGPDRFRSSNRLPYHGVMSFDSADMAAMERDGSLFSVVAHEIGHILGIGTLWEDFGLLVGPGTSNPLYTGANGLAAYNQIFGRNASGVPVENTGGGGTRDGHWRDSLLGNELMTGYAGPGVNLPLSRITVGALADLGYVVSVSAADAYSPPSAARSVAAANNGAVSMPAQMSAVSDAAAGARRIELDNRARIDNSHDTRGRSSSQTQRIDAFYALLRDVEDCLHPTA